MTSRLTPSRTIRSRIAYSLLPGEAGRAYGERLREALRELFGLIHRRDEMTAGQFGQQLQAAREKVLRVRMDQVPAGRQAQSMAKRLGKYGKENFTFVTTSGVQPTNNLAEQAICFVVIDRNITRGTRGETGRRWSERIWTVLASCAQHGRGAWDT